MSDDDLPIRSHYDPPITSPHEVVGEPGITHHYVFAGPNARRRPETATDQPISDADLAPLAASLNMAPRPPEPSRLREAVHYLYNVAYAFSMVAATITAALLALEYPQLSVPSRLACGTITVLVCAWVTVRRIRYRRAVRS